MYKTVEILHDINVIQILNTGEDSFRYDADISEHYHLRCLKCGAVDDALMDDGVKLQLTQDVEKQSGYTTAAVSSISLVCVRSAPRCIKL